MDKAEAREDFDEFLMAMDDQLEWLEGEASKRGVLLDKSSDIPEEIERLFDLMSENMSEDDVSRLLVVFGRYLGEYVRINHGGKWVLPLEDEKNINFNIPVITGHSKVQGLEFAPIRVMRAYSLRRNAGVIRKAIENHISPQILDLSEELARENAAKGE
ncbi:hypothetical protein DM872_09630 [Pseudomonas taiwanensis]|nr:hypothetical protein [Pseudomonas taiwanensis]